MCGITGVFAFNEIGRFDMIKNRVATDLLEHRGPDVGRFFNDHYVALGHRRLSILDLSAAANQPMSDPSGRFQLVFNGEIYNFRQLRQALEQKGITFETTSDTEVLLHLLIHEGEAALQKLDGFFTFCFYDSQAETMLLARDRFGIKPLVYAHDEDKFVFSSELNSLRAYNIPNELDPDSLLLYLQLHYIPAPRTIWKGVKKLLPGHFLRVKQHSVETVRYYELPYKENELLSDYQSAKQELLSLMERSVQERLISDVPLGAFLSGGIDSSAIVALASRHTQNLQTFSIGYKDEPRFDETRYAQAVAKKFNTQHTVFSLTNDDIFEGVNQLLGHSLGEPFADSSMIPTFILSQQTAKHVKVALSGDGGDELFGGYQKYWGEYKVRQGGFVANLLKNNRNLLAKLPQSRNSFWTNKFRQAYRFAEAMHQNPKQRYQFLSSFLNEEKARQVLSKTFQESDQQEVQNDFWAHFSRHIRSTKGSLNDVLRSDVEQLLPNDMLFKVDHASMASSLEVRVPFLDHELAAFAFRLPESFKIDGKLKKRILQDTFREILPSELYNRPKQGFDVPLKRGFETVLRPLVEQSFSTDFIKSQGIFDRTYIQNLKENVLSGGYYEQNHVWALLVFQEWWQKQH